MSSIKTEGASILSMKTPRSQKLRDIPIRYIIEICNVLELIALIKPLIKKYTPTNFIPEKTLDIPVIQLGNNKMVTVIPKFDGLNICLPLYRSSDLDAADKTPANIYGQKAIL